MRIRSGVLTNVLCRSRDAHGEFLMVSINDANLGEIRLRAREQDLPLETVPKLIGAEVDWVQSEVEPGLLLGFNQQSVKIFAFVFNKFIKASKDALKEIPFIVDPWAREIDS